MVAPRAYRGPSQAARQRGGSDRAIVRRGDAGRAAAISRAKQGDRTIGRNIDRSPSDVARQKGADTPSLARRTPGDRDVTTGSGRAAALVGDRNTAIQKSVLRSRAFADPSARDRSDRARAPSTFRGKFAEKGKHFDHPPWAKRFHRDRFHRPIFVIGWIGPVFWPFAYDDFIDYTFWPYAYDTFWPYAYDDVYVSIFGPYSYASRTYASAPAYREGGRAPVRVPPSGVAQVCSGEASGLTDWPIEHIAQTVEPDEPQRAALTELKNAAAQAIELMKSACPTDLPGTPTGRLAAMRVRLEAMLQAVAIVRPALERFYDSLSDEQKARFNALSDERPTARGARTASRQGPDLAQACTPDVTATLPIERVREGVRPSEEQGAALDALYDASRKAAELLRANCPADQSLTPPGRVAAMEQRLKIMVEALDTMQPALERFYTSLSDEQKARFNQLGARQARR